MAVCKDYDESEVTWEQYETIVTEYVPDECLEIMDQGSFSNSDVTDCSSNESPLHVRNAMMAGSKAVVKPSLQVSGTNVWHPMDLSPQRTYEDSDMTSDVEYSKSRDSFGSSTIENGGHDSLLFSISPTSIGKEDMPCYSASESSSGSPLGCDPLAKTTARLETKNSNLLSDDLFAYASQGSSSSLSADDINLRPAGLDRPLDRRSLKPESFNVASLRGMISRREPVSLDVPWFKIDATLSREDNVAESSAPDPASVRLPKRLSSRASDTPSKIASWLLRGHDPHSDVDNSGRRTSMREQPHDRGSSREVVSEFIPRNSLRSLNSRRENERVFRGNSARCSKRQDSIKRFSTRSSERCSGFEPMSQLRHGGSVREGPTHFHSNTAGHQLNSRQYVTPRELKQQRRRTGPISQLVSGLSMRSSTGLNVPRTQKSDANMGNVYSASPFSANSLGSTTLSSAEPTTRRPSFFRLFSKRNSIAEENKDGGHVEDKKDQKGRFVRFASLRHRGSSQKQGIKVVPQEAPVAEETNTSTEDVEEKVRDDLAVDLKMQESEAHDISGTLHSMIGCVGRKKSTGADSKQTALTYGATVPFKDMDMSLIEVTGVSVTALSRKAMNRTKTARSLLKKTYKELTEGSLHAIGTSAVFREKSFLSRKKNEPIDIGDRDGILITEMQLRVNGRNRYFYREEPLEDDDINSDRCSSVEVLDLDDFLDDEWRHAMHSLEERAN